jgi:hypothetical protein
VLPAILDVAIPVAIKQLGKYAGLDRVLVGLLLALLIQSIAFFKRFVGKLRKNGGDECNVLTVGRPKTVADSGTKVG